MASIILSYETSSDGCRLFQKNRSRKTLSLSAAFILLQLLQHGIRFSILLPPPLLCGTRWSTVMFFCFRCWPQYAQWPLYLVKIDSRFPDVISLHFSVCSCFSQCLKRISVYNYSHIFNPISIEHGLWYLPVFVSGNTDFVIANLKCILEFLE